MHWLCCFFFQAEDGIRDGHVTGVQTCALPIFGVEEKLLDAKSLTGRSAFGRLFEETTASLTCPFTHDGQISELSVQAIRSEERRVGKECRSRWARDH